MTLFSIEIDCDFLNDGLMIGFAGSRTGGNRFMTLLQALGYSMTYPGPNLGVSDMKLVI
jgi:hypothetical protein